MSVTEFIDLGLKRYNEAWDFQVQSFEKVLESRNKEQCFYLIFCEHPHVFTLGKNGKPGNLLVNNNFLNSINAEFVQTDRGGDITYHGPGQIVVYPIIDLTTAGYGIKDYVFKLEQSVIDSLKEYGITAYRSDGATGVWLKGDGKQERKICAIGVRVSRGITMHGLAFNIMTDLKYFNYINPCGFTDKGVTSLEKELGYCPAITDVKALLKSTLAQHLLLNLI